MTKTAFNAWQKNLGLSIHAAARAIGKSPAQVCRYKNGYSAVPRTVEIACQQVQLFADLDRPKGKKAGAVALKAKRDFDKGG